MSRLRHQNFWDDKSRNHDDKGESDDAGGKKSPAARFLTPDLVRRCNGKIRDIENLEALEQLEELDLSFNEISIARNLGALTQLRILNLAQNRIVKLDGCFEWLDKLENLNLSGNLLESIPPVLGKLKALRTLRLARNKIERAADLERLRPLDRLSSLTLVGNPCAVETATRDLAIFTIRSLDVLDGEAVKIAQREAARARFEDTEAEQLRAALRQARVEATRRASQQQKTEAELASVRAACNEAAQRATTALREKEALRSELDAKTQMLDHKANFASDVANELSDIKQHLLFARIDGARPEPLVIDTGKTLSLPSQHQIERSATSPRMLGNLRNLKERIRLMQEEELGLAMHVGRLQKSREAAQDVLESAQTEFAHIRALILQWPTHISAGLSDSPRALRSDTTSLEELESVALAHQSRVKELEATLEGLQRRDQFSPLSHGNIASNDNATRLDELVIAAVTLGQEHIGYAQAVEELARACISKRPAEDGRLQEARDKLQSAKDCLRRAVAAQRKAISDIDELSVQHRLDCEAMLVRRAELAQELRKMRDSPELDAKFAPAVAKIEATVASASALKDLAVRVGANPTLSLPSPGVLVTTVDGASVAQKTRQDVSPRASRTIAALRAELERERQRFRALKHAHARGQQDRAEAATTETIASVRAKEREERVSLERELGQLVAESQREKDQALERERKALERALESEATVESLKKEAKAAKSDQDRLSGELSVARNELEEQTHATGASKREIANLKASLEEASAKLEAEQKLTARLHRQAQDTTDLRGEITRLEKENSELDVLADAFSKTLGVLAQALESREFSFDATAAVNQILDGFSPSTPTANSLQRFGAAVQACTVHLERAREETAKIDTQLLSAKEQQVRYDRIKESLPKLKEELCDAESRAKTCSSMATKEEERLRSLSLQTEEMQNRLTDLRGKVVDARNKLADADAQASAAASQSRTLAREVESLRAQKASLELQQATLEETCAASRVDQARIASEARKEQDRINDLRQQGRALEMRLEILRTERDDAAQQIKSLSAQNEEASRANAEAAAKQREHIREAADQERAFDRLSSQVQDLTQKVRELTKRQASSQKAVEEAERRREKAARDLADLQRQAREYPEIMEISEARQALADLHAQRVEQERRLQVLELYQLTEMGQVGGSDAPPTPLGELGEAAQVLDALKQVYVEGLRQVQEAFLLKEQRLKQALRHAREELNLARRKHEEQLVAVNDALASEGHQRLLAVAQDLRESVVRLAAHRDVDFRVKDAQTALAEKDAKLVFLSGQIEALQKEMHIREDDLRARNDRLQAMLEKALEHIDFEDTVSNADARSPAHHPSAPTTTTAGSHRAGRRRSLSTPRPTSPSPSPAYVSRSPPAEEGPVNSGNVSAPEVRANRTSLSKFTRVRARRAHIHMQEDGRVGIDLVQSQRSAALTLPVNLAPNVSLHTMVYNRPEREQIDLQAVRSPLTDKVRELRLELEAMKQQRF
ncbi:Centriolin [Hondaea fermentalgiana]|uniref:Centriolin n=1 Tax=Hondaea fermentalgiana TaxID=2315210 RepID=A0A2R5G2Z8_9STRA|nr:Centriolin [Hondaea fermentalgiana]|eukprot:GBG25407.1 Centriolin [Hondaea fermentalgiana]